MRKVKLISKKGLTKHLINKYNILNGLKYFFEERSQNSRVFNHFLVPLQRLLDPIEFFHGNPKEYQKKALKLHLRQTIALH